MVDTKCNIWWHISKVWCKATNNYRAVYLRKQTKMYHADITECSIRIH